MNKKKVSAKDRDAAPINELVASITRLPSMTEGAFRARVGDELKKLGLEQSEIDRVISNSASRVFLGDTLQYRLSHTKWHKSLNPVETLASTKGANMAPVFGKLLICLFVPCDKQEDRLADFEELMIKVWAPNFGKLAGAVYIGNAIRSACDVWRIRAAAAILDGVIRVFKRFSGSG